MDLPYLPEPALPKMVIRTKDIHDFLRISSMSRTSPIWLFSKLSLEAPPKHRNEQDLEALTKMSIDAVNHACYAMKTARKPVTHQLAKHEA
jgi:hypothetical protein